MLTPESHDDAELKSTVGYISSLGRLKLPSLSRAADPFRNHPWVYAAASAAALNASSVRYVVWRETDETQQVRLKSTHRAPGRRDRRRAIQRHLSSALRKQGYRMRGLEEDLDHPLSDVFIRPNPVHVTGMQMMYVSFLWMFLRGECFLLCLDADRKPVAWDSGSVAEIWPVSPDLVTEQLVGNLLTGWWMSMGQGAGSGVSSGVRLNIDEMIHIHWQDPNYPIRGMSPLSAAAAGINLDMLAVTHNTSVMTNGGAPGGIMMHKGPGAPFKSVAEKDEFEAKIRQRHQGPENANRTMWVMGDWAYQAVGLAPKDMDFLNQRKWTREEILGVMGIPASVLSITERITFATNLAQDRSFWDKKLIPMMMLFEAVYDATLFYDEPDSVLGGFDLSKVEALKVGLADKIKTCMDLTGAQLHMDPRTAYELVGLEVPDYDGDDVQLIAAGLQTLSDTITISGVSAENAKNPPPPPPGGIPGSDVNKLPGAQHPATGGQDGSRSPNDEPRLAPPALAESMSAPVIWLPRTRDVRRSAGLSRWRSLTARVQQPTERRMVVAWQKFVRGVRARQLKRFDKGLRGVRLSTVLRSNELDPDEVLLTADDLGEELQVEFDPIYEQELQDAVTETADELGLTPDSIALDDPVFADALQQRIQILSDTAPNTMYDSMRQALLEGMQAGETVQELRQRVADELDIAASSSKALTVARTESAGFMNDARDALFDQQGIDDLDWVTAGDENVRTDHRIFGTLGPQKRGFNYLTAVKKESEGQLTRPHDPYGPADEVINCRCVQVPG
jgi:phage portal protein BeeE